MAIHLSKERYESTPFGALISWGVIENSPDGCYMTSDGPEYLIWGAWKGGGNDWAIYVDCYILWQTITESELWLLHSHGDKVIDPRSIDRMVHAVPEVNARYRR